VAERDREHFTVPGAGHYGIFSGRRWREQVYPKVRGFIAAHAASGAKPTTGERPRKVAGKAPKARR